MPTYSPEQALARPTGRAPLWGEGLLAAALWLMGGLFTLTWPDAGRRWPFSEGWALAQFTLGGGLLLLALSYRYWRARGARVLHASKWLALLPVLFAVWEGLTAKTAVLPVPFFAPPQALIEVLHDDWPRLLDSLLHSLGLLGLGVLLGTSSGFIHWSGHRLVATDWLLGASGVTSAGAGAVHRAAAAVPVYFSLELRRQRVFDRAEHLVPGHGADLVRSDGH
ncbi:alkanesulfonates transport system permease protein [Klebsiella pneumoniae]|nr:alkanesulfonates transport system permease protein [Klebsiella pneumoniae]